MGWLAEHEAVLWWLVAASIGMFVGTLLVVPVLVVRLPADYFRHEKRRAAPWRIEHPLLWLLARIAKNVLGIVFVVLGLAMLFLPGQGLLTLLIGLTLLDFPGKYALERWLVARRPVLRSINWMRRRAGREELAIEQAASTPARSGGSPGR